MQGTMEQPTGAGSPSHNSEEEFMESEEQQDAALNSAARVVLLDPAVGLQPVLLILALELVLRGRRHQCLLFVAWPPA